MTFIRFLLLSFVIVGSDLYRIGEALSQTLVAPVGVPDAIPTTTSGNANGYKVTNAFLCYVAHKGFGYHAGSDLSNSKFGGEIRAFADGIVIDEDSGGGWGDALLLRHDNLPGGILYSQYAHMQNWPYCLGGDNDGKRCALDSECPEGACVQPNFYCVGGSNDKKRCGADDDCPGGDCHKVGRYCDGGENEESVCTTDTDCPGATCLGDTVVSGQPIGMVGNTGVSVGDTGHHLHFEVKDTGTFGYGYFNVYNDVTGHFERRKCDNSGNKCASNVDCIEVKDGQEDQGECELVNSSEGFVDPLAYIELSGAGVSRSRKFVVGDTVEVKEKDVNVRNDPKYDRDNPGVGVIGQHSPGEEEIGEVIDGPAYACSMWWWKVDFDEGPDGWVAEEFLEKVAEAPVDGQCGTVATDEVCSTSLTQSSSDLCSQGTVSAFAEDGDGGGWSWLCVAEGVDASCAEHACVQPPTNQDPVAEDDAAETESGVAVEIDVLANDSDADGDTLTVSSVTDGASGSATTDGTSVTYTSDTDFAGTDSFTYTISDGNGGTATATVTVEVAAAPAQPTASLTATPESIGRGESATLSWSSTNADACTGAGFSTGENTSGTVPVAPTATSTYSVTCTGSGGDATASATVEVTGGVEICDVANPIVPCEIDGVTYDTFAGNYSQNRVFYKASSYDASITSQGYLWLDLKSGLPHTDGYAYVPHRDPIVWTSPDPYNVDFGIFGQFNGATIKREDHFEWIGVGSADLPVNHFLPGDTVEVTEAGVNVRSEPNGTILDTRSPGVQGEVGDGPTLAGEYWWWRVEFEDGLIGWVADQYLQASAGSPTTLALNDTGITLCANATSNDLVCPVTGFPGQDAEYGRDVTHSDDTDGHAGFSFTKLDADGNDLPTSATEWSCVRDNATGYVWEVKTNEFGLRNTINTYSWYNPDASTNGGNPGTQNGGNCVGGIACDTYSYVQEVNAQGLCGANDWYIPDRRALLSIVTNDRYEPSVDSDYFPNTLSYGYWSSSPYSYRDSDSWFVSFRFGDASTGGKGDARYVRLVRGGQ